MKDLIKQANLALKFSECMGGLLQKIELGGRMGEKRGGGSHRACVTSTGGGLLLPEAGFLSLMKRVMDATCLLKMGDVLPRPSPCSTCHAAQPSETEDYQP